MSQDDVHMTTAVAFPGVASSGTGALVADGMTGAKRSLYPNPVTLVMVPDKQDVPSSYRFRAPPDYEELLIVKLSETSAP